MTDTLTKFHNELDTLPERVTEVAEAQVAAALDRLDTMVQVGEHRQAERMAAFLESNA